MADDPNSTNRWLTFTPEPAPDAGVGAEESEPTVAEPVPTQGAAEVRPEESPPPDKPDKLTPSASGALECETEKTLAVNTSTSAAETASTPNTETMPIAGGGPVNVGWVDPAIAHAIGRVLKSRARGLEKSLPPDAQPSKPAPTPAVWSKAQILAWIISRDERKALTPEMLPKIEWAGKELTEKVNKELNKMLATSIEIDRAVLEGQTPHRLNEGVFRISGLRSRELAHLLRAGYLTLEDVQWHDIEGNPEGVKRLWPARTAAEACEVESEAPGERPDESTVGVQVSAPVQSIPEVPKNPPQTIADSAPGDSEPAAAKKRAKQQAKKQAKRQVKKQARRQAKKQANRQAKKQVKRQGPDRCSESDRALYPAITKLMKEEQLSAQEAAQRLADLGKIEGRGSANSRKLRLARRYRKEFQKH